jgi:hypothetical protein
MKGLLVDQITLDNIRTHAGAPLLREVIGRLPALHGAARSFFNDFQRGQLAFQINAASLDQRVNVLQTALERGIRRIVLSVLLVGLLLGSTLVLFVPFAGKVSEFESVAIRVIAEAGFVIGAVLIVILLLRTLWQSIQKSVDRNY